MPVYIAILFSLGALVGLTMAVTHFRGKVVPVGWGLLHGAFVGGGLIMLLVLLLGAEDPGRGWVIFGLFLLAALGGAFLFYRQQRDEPWPNLVILAHGGLALTTLVLLYLWLV